MQKLVKKDKLADSGGASSIPTCSSANRKKERTQLKGFSDWDLTIPRLLGPRAPRAAGTVTHITLTALLRLGAGTPAFSWLADGHPMNLLR